MTYSGYQYTLQKKFKRKINNIAEDVMGFIFILKSWLLRLKIKL